MSWRCDTKMQLSDLGPVWYDAYPMFPGDWKRGNGFSMTNHSDLMNFRSDLISSKKFTFVLINLSSNNAVIHMGNRFKDGQETSLGRIQFYEYYDGGSGGYYVNFLNFRVFRYNTDASLPLQQAGISTEGFPVIVTISSSLTPTLN